MAHAPGTMALEDDNASEPAVTLQAASSQVRYPAPPPSASSVPPARRPRSTPDIRPLMRTSVPATPDPPPAPCLYPHVDNQSPPLQHNTSPRPCFCVLLVDCRAGGQSATTIRARQRAPVEREMHPNDGGEEGAMGEQRCRGAAAAAGV
ncbi:hypothetical protein DFH09DRAFT_1287099 [Mycena vulgaris]|nr:hypothetical protein DFH09DRAFT_1287099 [Mycena vulgaris]